MEKSDLIRSLKEKVLAKAELSYYSLEEEKSIYHLSVLLFAHTHRRISHITLQRFFQQSSPVRPNREDNDEIIVSRFVLDTLALYAGSRNWEEFQQEVKRVE